MSFDPTKLTRGEDGFLHGADLKVGSMRVGLLLRIYCNDAYGKYPIHGSIDGELCQWRSDGKHIGFSDSFRDLINVPPKPKVIEGWMNFYEHDNSCLHKSRKDADNCCDDLRIACIPIKFTIGDGLSDDAMLKAREAKP